MIHPPEYLKARSESKNSKKSKRKSSRKLDQALKSNEDTSYFGVKDVQPIRQSLPNKN